MSIRSDNTQPSGLMAEEGVEYRFSNAGQDWIASWHSPTAPPPSGTSHGSSAISFTSDGEVVLVSSDRCASWGLPGGRPEGDEDWRTTLDRELLEEACAQVDEATLLGFNRGVCVRGYERGLVLVRAKWYARVTLLPWVPQHEMTHRRLIEGIAELREFDFPNVAPPTFERWVHEAQACR